MAETEPPAATPTFVSQRVILKHDEVMAAAIASRSRGRNGGTALAILLLVLLCVAIWLGHMLAFWLAQRLPIPVMMTVAPYVPVVVPALISLFAVKIALDVEQWRSVRSYLAHLRRVGSPLVREGIYEVTPEALVLTTERIVIAPRWHALDTIGRGDAGWVVSADQLHFLIPYADFPSPDAQRPLLAAITARMTPEARARSRDAVEFAEVPPETEASAHSPRNAAELSLPVAAPPVEEITARGWLTGEQAAWASGVIYARLARPRFHRWAFPLTGGVTGLIVGIALVALAMTVLPYRMLASFPMATAIAGYLLPLIGGALGLALAYKRLGVVLDKAWRGALTDRGVPAQMEAEWALTATGLAYRTARFSGEAAYGAIHQLLHEHGYWIVAVDSLTLCIPDTAFASPESAQAFMAALLERMGDEARQRSVTLPAAASAS